MLQNRQQEKVGILHFGLRPDQILHEELNVYICAGKQFLNFQFFLIKLKKSNFCNVLLSHKLKSFIVN